MLYIYIFFNKKAFNLLKKNFIKLLIKNFTLSTGQKNHPRNSGAKNNPNNPSYFIKLI